jgi:hypothetical protein
MPLDECFRPATEDRGGIRSRVEGDKLIVPENYGEWQEGQHFGGNDGKLLGGNSATGFSLSRVQHYGK